jgi:hypothetical protein
MLSHPAPVPALFVAKIPKSRRQIRSNDATNPAESIRYGSSAVLLWLLPATCHTLIGAIEAASLQLVPFCDYMLRFSSESNVL